MADRQNTPFLSTIDNEQELIDDILGMTFGEDSSEFLSRESFDSLQASNDLVTMNELEKIVNDYAENSLEFTASGESSSFQYKQSDKIADLHTEVGTDRPCSQSPKNTKEEESRRSWDILHSLFSSEAVIIKMRTRRQEFSEFIPERLYSSLVYDIKMSLNGEGVLINNQPISSILILKLQLINASNSSVLEKGSKVLLKNTECALQIDPNSPFTYIGKLKFQINPKIECAYHKTRKEFKLQLIVNAEKNDVVVLHVESPSCKIFARYPDNKRKRDEYPNYKSNKKKKFNNEENMITGNSRFNQNAWDDVTEFSGVRKSESDKDNVNGYAVSQTKHLIEFEYQLNEICQFCSNMSNKMRVKCLKLISQRVAESILQ